VSKCTWCGAEILWIHGPEGKRLPIENGFTPYKRHSGEGWCNRLYTSAGGVIPCMILPESRAEEADGYAHKVHLCAKKPIYHRPRPMTRREKYKAMYE
jgi:hypothetical protein